MSSRRWVLVATATVAVLTLAVAAVLFGGVAAAAGALAALSTLSGLIGGLFAWGKRQPSSDEIAASEEAICEETLRRTVKALPELVSFQGLLTIDAEPRLRLVHDPFNRVDTAEVDSVGAAFDASQGRLLIVGAPASGKSISAYRLAGQLATCRDEQGSPVLVNLSAWEDQERFNDFLVDYMCASGAGYRLPSRRVVQAWLDKRKYQLILDGLDEVPAVWRMDLVDRLEDWLPVDMRVVITCRTAEYNEMLRSRPRGISLAMAVELQPLDDTELDRACAEVASRRGELGWNSLLEESEPDVQAVREALRTPLLLNLAASGRMEASELRVAGRHGATGARAFIIDRFLRNCTDFDPELFRWVEWIGGYLDGQHAGPFGIGSHDSSVFEISRLTPGRCPFRLIGIATGLAVGLAVGAFILAGFVGAFAANLTLIMFFMFALPLLFVPQLRNASPSHVHVRLFSWRRLARSSLRTTALFAVAFMFTLLAYYALAEDPSWFDGSLFGLALGLPTASVYFSWQILRPSRVRTSSAFDGPWGQSRRTAWFVGLTVWAVVSIVTFFTFLLANEIDAVYYFGHDFRRQGISAEPGVLVEMSGFALLLGLVIAVHAALNAGGWFLILQSIANRRLARRHGLSKRPLDVFQRGMRPVRGMLPLLRPVGSGVRFIHNDVRDRLVARHFDGTRPLP